MDKLKLLQVQYLPKELETGVLYYSKEFHVAGHLCPCGCGNKIITPISPIDWSINIENDKPTLYPSLGNWQLPCRSHYWITRGEIEWSNQWSEEWIKAGYENEELQRKLYYEKLQNIPLKQSILPSILKWFWRNNGKGKLL